MVWDIDPASYRGQRLLGLFAHPDDEVFCVGGTFAMAAKHGAETMVVSFTSGEAGSIRHANIATRANLGRVRAEELRRSCDELGVAQARCLDFRDGALASTERRLLVEAAVEQIRSFRPDAVYSFDETGGSGHPDHIVMSAVALEACRVAADAHAHSDFGPPSAPKELFQATFPQNDRLLLQLLVTWLHAMPERFRGSTDFANALLMFADGSSMLGYASDHLRVEWFPAGSYIIEQGEPASALYLVLSGSVDVIVEAGGGTRKLAEAVAGDFLGETAIATGQPRSAHCVAAENTACFVLSPWARDNHLPRGTAPRRPTPRLGCPEQLDERPVLGNSIDVRDFVAHKVAALAQHRTQYTIAPGLFPDSMMQELLGIEQFQCVWSQR